MTTAAPRRADAEAHEAAAAATAKVSRSQASTDKPGPAHRPAGSRGRRLAIVDRMVVTHGLPSRIWLDLYHYLMKVSWLQLFSTFAGLFVAFNAAYALLYLAVPGSIANLNPDPFWGCFFFSVETLATVGYGDMHPQTLYGHTVASIEIFTGMMSTAVMTGAIFARFSRPQARFLFARYGVVRPVDGRTTLMFRAANARQNIVMEASAHLRMLRDSVTQEGLFVRRVVDLPLLRDQHPIFLLGWNLMHVIDEHSPLFGETLESLERVKAVFLLNLSGTDETTGQVLMARQEYRSNKIRWNHSFRDILHTADDGQEHIDYTVFHQVDPL